MIHEFLNTMADYLIEHQVDMVIGSRFIEKRVQSSITRRMGIQFFSKLIKVLTGKKNYRSNIRVKNDRT